MPIIENAGLRSDGELVQAVSDTFEFVFAQRETRAEDTDHKGWSDILSVGTNTSRSDPDDDDGLPDTIIWCLDGNGTGSATDEDIMVTYEYRDRIWSVNGEEVDDAGLSSLLFLG